MADFEAPSFSLGFDFDLEDSDPQPTHPNESTRTKSPEIMIIPSSPIEEKDEDFRPETLNQNLQVEETPLPALKRLKRGLQTQSTLGKKKEFEFPSANLDDDIEEFSSQEDPCEVENSSVQSHSMCSSSKFPLHGRKVLMTQSVSKPKIRKSIPPTNASISANVEAIENKQVFPKLTISPLRRFQLLDSDSDDPSDAQDLYDNAKKINAIGKENCNPLSQSGTDSQQKRVEPSASIHRIDDLWKAFCPKKEVSIKTPALDEFCEEYFSSVKDKNAGQKNVENIPLNNSNGRFHKDRVSEFGKQSQNLPNPLIPAHCYFYHDDPRIQRLVRDRLPNFCPLGVVDNKANISNAEVLDYRGQFGQRESSSQFHVKRKRDLEGSSSKEKRNLNCSVAKQVSKASRDWVDPKSCASIPRDAGKRRIQADVHSAGHWYTGQDGRKVYVSKNGQEFTGRLAYIQYKKESGTGFKRSGKKATSKKR